MTFSKLSKQLLKNGLMKYVRCAKIAGKYSKERKKKLSADIIFNNGVIMMVVAASMLNLKRGVEKSAPLFL